MSAKSAARKQLESALIALTSCSCPCVTVPDKYRRRQAYAIAAKAGMVVTVRKVNGGGYQVRRIEA